jgi:hypothetical protein
MLRLLWGEWVRLRMEAIVAMFGDELAVTAIPANA